MFEWFENDKSQNRKSQTEICFFEFSFGFDPLGTCCACPPRGYWKLSSRESAATRRKCAIRKKSAQLRRRGQHGKRRKAESSRLRALQLREEAEGKEHYGVGSRIQFRRYFEQGRGGNRAASREDRAVASCLERRLDQRSTTVIGFRGPRGQPRGSGGSGHGHFHGERAGKVDIPFVPSRPGRPSSRCGRAAARNASIRARDRGEVKGRGVPEGLVCDARMGGRAFESVTTREQINLPVAGNSLIRGAL